jgi:hypothetical protein
MIEQLSFVIAVPERKNPLVLNRALEKTVDFCLVVLFQEVDERILESVGNEVGANVQVTDKPTEGELIHERYRHVSQQYNCCGKGQNEAE